MTFIAHGSGRQPAPKPRCRLQLMALGLKADAKACLTAAASIDNSTDGLAPLQQQLLLCHAIWFILKADLVSQGESEERLAQFGRDLAEMLGRARQLGYSPTDRRTDHIVGWLSSFHIDFAFRNQRITEISYPRASQALEVATAMIDDISLNVVARYRAFLGSSKEHTYGLSRKISAAASLFCEAHKEKTPAQHRDIRLHDRC
jgi:hypothetical protein